MLIWQKDYPSGAPLPAVGENEILGLPLKWTTLLAILVIAALALFAFYSSRKAGRTNDAEERYRSKYGRPYPSTEQRQKDSAGSDQR